MLYIIRWAQIRGLLVPRRDEVTMYFVWKYYHIFYFMYSQKNCGFIFLNLWYGALKNLPSVALQ